MKITIVGFGNIAHALIAYMGAKENIKISILTSSIIDTNSIVLSDNSSKGIIYAISSQPSKVIPDSDLILLTTPSHVRFEAIKKIAPFVSQSTIIGAFPGIGGFYDEIQKIFGNDMTVFASQRVPYIARVVERGKEVTATPKKSISIAINHNQAYIQELLSGLLDMDVDLLDSFMEVHLTNSNPILHSARLFSLYTECYPLSKEVLFYKEWDDNASKVLLQMDEEFMDLIKKLELQNISSLKKHYEVQNYQQMTQKLQSIKAFEGIKTPLIKVDNQYIFDINSRYFQEDINHDLLYIIKTANKNLVQLPTINRVYKKLSRLTDDK
jgi:hypothetical protein